MPDLTLRRYRRPVWGYIAVALIALLPVFGHLDDLPIQLFDEQRLATNALELKASGNLIVTTYDGQPDYSNTKPPLMIWLQALSMLALGDNELGVRMPAALAALATCLVLYGFCARRLRSPLLGICSVLVLCTMQGYITLHGTRTGDYDSLLTLFTTAYCFSYFAYLEDGKPGRLYATFILLMLAVMTKCIAGCLLLPALLIYTLWQRKLKLVLTSKHFYIGSLILIVPVAAYYLYRQSLDPGYFDAVVEMDLGGRYLKPLSIPRRGDFYIDFLLKSWAIPWFGVSVAGIAAGLYARQAIIRRATLYVTLLTTCFIAVLSVSATKFSWYLLPAYPLLSILAGMCIYVLLQEFLKKFPTMQRGSAHGASFAFAALLFIWPYAEALGRSLNPQTEINMMENGTMGYFLKDVIHHRRSIEGAYVAIESYQGDVRWYLRVLKAHGRPVPTIEDRKFLPGQKVIAYQNDLRNFIQDHFEAEVLEDFRGVITYRIIRRKS